jgi:hypothetical protein
MLKQLKSWCRMAILKYWLCFMFVEWNHLQYMTIFRDLLYIPDKARLFCTLFSALEFWKIFRGGVGKN